MNEKRIIEGFNLLAPFYDVLVKLFFGNAILKTQTHFISEIKNANSILIFGGGTGKILKACAQQNAIAQYCYVDISPEMITQAAQQSVLPNIQFVTGSYTDIPAQKFDIIITPFVLDCFTETDLKNKVIPVLSSKLSVNGKWLFSDFKYADTSRFLNFISKTIIQTLYFFFRCVCALPVKKLPDFNSAFIVGNLKEINSKTFFGGMLVAQVYRKK